MKNLNNHSKSTLLFLLLLVITNCKQPEEITYSVINGVIHNYNPKIDKVFLNKNEFSKELQITEKGVFADTIPVKNNEIYKLSIGYQFGSIYLEKGKNLSLECDSKKVIETIVYHGELSQENNYLASKTRLIAKSDNIFKLSALKQNEFLKSLRKQNNTIDSLYTISSINNKVFNSIEKKENRYTYVHALENYQGRHRYASGDKEFVVSNDFYDKLKDINYKDSTAYRSSEAYQKMLSTHLNRITEVSSNESFSLSYFKNIDTFLPDGYAKDKLMYNNLLISMGPNNLMKQEFSIYKNSNPNIEHFTSINEAYDGFIKVAKGTMAPVFEFKNYNDDMVSLEDFEGKYLYIDVWATWCVPCIVEFPYIEKLKEEYKDKNIEFIGISIDRKKYFDKWKNMVVEKKLDGIQLFIGSDSISQFEKDYAIKNIPRFMLIDPDGKIISADALRPSDPELKILLNKLLL